MLKQMKLQELNPHIMCILCKGYIVDATTIVECLHSFCRSCIVTYLHVSFHCPVCNVEVHKTRPLLHIRPDHTLQDVVNKIVPGLYYGEAKRRKEFEEHVNNLEQREQTITDERDETSISSSNNNEKREIELEDPVCITMEYYRKNRRWMEKQVFPTRYLRCPSAVTVSVLKRFLVMKFSIPDTHKVEIIRSDEIIDEHLTMKDVSRIYGLFTKHFLDLQYIFLEVASHNSKGERGHTSTLKMTETERTTRLPLRTQARASKESALSEDRAGKLSCSGPATNVSGIAQTSDLSPTIRAIPPNFETSPCYREIHLLQKNTWTAVLREGEISEVQL